MVIELGRDPADGKRKQRWFSGYRTRRDAQNDLPRLLLEAQAGTTAIRSTSMTVGQYPQGWLADYAEMTLGPWVVRRASGVPNKFPSKTNPSTKTNGRSRHVSGRHGERSIRSRCRPSCRPGIRKLGLPLSRFVSGPGL